MTKQLDPNEVAEYHILDPHMREVAGQRLTKGQKTIRLSHGSAAFFVASNVLSLQAPDSAVKVKPEPAPPPQPAVGEVAGDATTDRAGSQRRR